MSDAFRKVRPGERFTMPASAYNAFIDAALDHQQRQNIGGGKPWAIRQASLVLVRNDSGSAVAQFGVLGISGVVFDPVTAADSFKGRVALTGVTPIAGTHEGRFVITAEPIPDGEIGPAYVAGVCQVQVNVTDAVHNYAEIANADAAKLASGETGSALIVWKETGTGTKWAVVALHAATASAGSTDADLIRVKHTTAGTTCPRGGILQISSVILAGDGSIDYVNCVRPADVNKPNVLVAQEQIAYNAFGYARVAGLTELYTTAYASLAVGDLVGSWPNSFEAVARQDEFTHQVVHKESNRIWGVRVDPGFGATVGGRVLRVKAKADAGASTGLSVIRVDLNNNEIGSTFTVYTISGTNWNTLWPRIASGNYLLASFIGQRWYGLPPFGSVGACV